MFTQFVNYIQKNVGTTAVTLVTCPTGNQLVVNQLSCANTTGLTVTCSVTVTRAGTVVFIVNNATVPAGGSLICAGDDQKIVLMAGDVIQVRSSTASSIDAVVSGVLNDFNRTATVPAPPTSPVATFSITPSTTSTFEGNTITYSVATTNVPNGTVLYWQNFGTTTAQDFTDDRNDGEFVITSNAGSFTRTLKTTGQGGDPGGESSETIQIAVQFRPGYLGGGAVAGAATVTVLPDTVITSGLVLRLDAGNFASYPGSGTIWTNLAGVGNNGTLTNGPTFSTANGGNIVFDGVNDYVVATSPGSYQNYTFELFCRWNAPTSASDRIFGLSSFGTYTVYAPTNIGFHYNPVGGSPPSVTLSSNVNIGYGTWCHIAVTVNPAGSLVTIYVNGVSRNSWNVIPAGDFVGNLFLGAQNAVPGLVANCNIGAFSLYDRVLSANEVAQNFSALRGRYGI